MGKALKVCPTPGCFMLVESGRCPSCRGEAERRRGTRQARGYGKQHDQARAKLLRTWTPGTPCPKCNVPQWDPAVLDAGHSVDLRTNPDAVADQLECRRCNRGWRRAT